MRALLALWCKELLVLSRDLHGLAVLFLMPAAFIVIMSLALSEAFREDGRPTTFAVLSPAGAKVAQPISDALASANFRAAPAPADETAARNDLRRGALDVVLLVRGDAAAPELTLLAEPTLPPTELLAFQSRVMAVALGKPLGVRLAVEVVGNPRGGRPSAVQQNVPAWLIFGMFFVAIPMSALFIVERRDRTLARLMTQRVPFALILAGKIAPFFAVNLVQAVLMLAAGVWLVPWLGGESLVLPARWDLLALVTACTSLAAISWALLIAVCARTIEQATVIGGVGNILAAAIGGIMVPRFVMPPSMQAMTELSPMAWALEGFHAVMLRQGGAADVALPCLKLALLAALLAFAALWFRRKQH